MTSQDRNGNKDSWRIRRRFMFVTTAFSASVIAYVLGTGLDTRPAETAVTMAFVQIVLTVGSYVFAAAWEDISGHATMPTMPSTPAASRKTRDDK
jgi:hypothetical protein